MTCSSGIIDWVYALVPFANEDDKCDQNLKIKAWDRHQHYRVGYTENDLIQLFPSPLIIAGTYYSDAGLILRNKLNSLSASEIIASKTELINLAQSDIKNLPPGSLEQHQGIKILSSR